MIELLDYILDYDDNFWIINAINDHVWGYIVYSVDQNGKRYNNITKKYYKKNIDQGLKIIPDYKRVFKPRDFYLAHKKDLQGVWANYVSALNDIGIKDSDIKQVFDKSFTGENGRARSKSTGMGLYIAKKMCEKLGHKIAIESVYSKYTKVFITISKDAYYDILK